MSKDKPRDFNTKNFAYTRTFVAAQTNRGDPDFQVERSTFVQLTLAERSGEFDLFPHNRICSLSTNTDGS